MLPMAYPLNMRSLDILFALLFTGVVACQLMYVMRDSERVFRSLHAFEIDSPVRELVRPRAPPSTFFALDWLVHPKHNRDGTSFFMRLGTETGSCYSSGMSWNDADCGPEWWQRYACLRAPAARACCVFACACCVVCAPDTTRPTRAQRELLPPVRER